MSEGIIPFTNATDYQCWLYANCEKCRKYHENLDDNGYSKCEIDQAIALSACGIGMTDELANRMGGVKFEEFPDSYNFFQRSCTEIELMS